MPLWLGRFLKTAFKKLELILSKYQEISHCYERKTVNGRWNYNLYTVIHGREREVVQRMVKEISDGIEVNEYKILYSTRDLKRTNVTHWQLCHGSGRSFYMISGDFEEMNDP